MQRVYGCHASPELLIPMPYVDRMDPTAPSSAAAPARPQPGVARTGLVVFAAVVTEIVIIGAACNQWVADRVGGQILRSALNGGNQTVRDFKQSLIAFSWRYAPRSFDHQHIWLGQVLMIATLLVVSGAVISLVTRGPITFGRALFGAWAAVVFATVLASYVRGLVNEGNTSSSPRITQALFETLGPNTPTLFAGMVLGLATGLITGFVAVTTRRAPVVQRAAEPGDAAYIEPEQPPPFFGSSPVPPWADQHYQPRGRHSAASASAPPPAGPGPDQPTAALPRPTDQPTAALPPPTDQPTAAFPRPPDDDDLGHEPRD
jgi:hypothetical protein